MGMVLAYSWLALEAQIFQACPYSFGELGPLATTLLPLQDINDMGDGVPLFSKFESEDWALTLLRFELFMLTTSFKKDCEDPDRTGIPWKG